VTIINVNILFLLNVAKDVFGPKKGYGIDLTVIKADTVIIPVLLLKWNIIVSKRKFALNNGIKF